MIIVRVFFVQTHTLFGLTPLYQKEYYSFIWTTDEGF